MQNITESICPQTLPFAIKIKAVTPSSVENKFNASNSLVNIFEIITTVNEIAYTIQSRKSKYLKGFFIFTPKNTRNKPLLPWSCASVLIKLH